MLPNVITDDEWVFPSHRFDARRGTFKPSPPALQRLGGHWLAFGSSVVAIDPISRTGAEVSLLSGKETPLSFDGFPALAGHVLVWKLSAKQLLVVGQTPPPAQVKASVYDLEARRWLPTGISVEAVPNGVFVFDATSLRLFLPGGLNPFGLVQRIGKRLLVTSAQADDGNPPCPPGASCLPHDERKVRHDPYSGLIEFRDLPPMPGLLKGARPDPRPQRSKRARNAVANRRSRKRAPTLWVVEQRRQ